LTSLSQENQSTSRGRKFRIGLNALFLRPGRVGGGETYARGLVAGFQGLNLPYEFVIFLNPEAYATFEELDSSPNFKRVLCSPPRNAWGRHLWENLNFSRLCHEHDLDLLHSLGNVLPIRIPCATAVTIHDLGYKVEPNAIPFMRRHGLGRMITASAHRADLIVTVSHTSERDIVHHLKVPAEKIHVTLEGPGQVLEVEAAWEEVRQRYKVSEPYFLTVGIEKHKRLDCIIEAAELLRTEHGYQANIVTTGPMGQLPSLHPMVKHFGFVPAEDLASLYKHAIALVCFSDLEGFGLTALEAMGLGTPVVASNAASLPEVMGDGGILVEHGDSAALSRAMWKIATDKHLQDDVRKRGYRRVANFSWMACAAETARAYETMWQGKLNRAESKA
jgi:glycosyltransferase involved in cell wall biosynthesis